MCTTMLAWWRRRKLLPGSSRVWNPNVPCNANMIELCEIHGIPCAETDFTLAHAYDADEAFVTGSFGGLTPVGKIDGRPLPDVMGPVSRQLRAAYLEYAKTAD